MRGPGGARARRARSESARRRARAAGAAQLVSSQVENAPLALAKAGLEAADAAELAPAKRHVAPDRVADRPASWRCPAYVQPTTHSSSSGIHLRSAPQRATTGPRPRAAEDRRRTPRPAQQASRGRPSRRRRGTRRHPSWLAAIPALRAADRPARSHCSSRAPREASPSTLRRAPGWCRRRHRARRAAVPRRAASRHTPARAAPAPCSRCTPRRPCSAHGRRDCTVTTRGSAGPFSFCRDRRSTR